MDHFTPNKDIKAAEQCLQCRTFARQFDLDNFYDVGQMGMEHALLPEKGLVAAGECHHRRGLPHLHLWRPGGLFHRRGLHRHGRRHGHGRDLVQGALRPSGST